MIRFFIQLSLVCSIEFKLGEISLSYGDFSVVYIGPHYFLDGVAGCAALGPGGRIPGFGIPNCWSYFHFQSINFFYISAWLSY